jgi:hypothetical protein
MTLNLLLALSKMVKGFASSPVNKCQQYRQDQELTVFFAKHHSWECILERAGLKEEFSLFFELIETGRYPLDNIALILFLETVKFYSLSNTSKMTYSDASKRFWKAGCKPFHAKFFYILWVLLLVALLLEEF